MTPPSAESPRPAAERRQLTVLFCDLVDSTTLATHLDPEELREVVRAYQRVCGEVIQRFEGYIAQHLGDGLLVYFGYPQAHEDDGQRAVHAALGMVEAVGRLNKHLMQERRVQLAIRLGIHTGLVVVGEMGGGSRHEQLALGETPNVAARLQGLAAPDTIVISAATQRLIQGAFAYQDLGAHMLKGLATPVQIFRVLQERDEQSRLDMVAGGGLTPMVGREQEIGLLLERWAQVKDGRGQVVLLSGEAGIGKSRLVQVVKEHVTGELHTRMEWRGSPYHQLSPLYPVIAGLPRRLGWHQEDSHQEKLHKLEHVLGRYDFSLPDMVPLFATLLTLPLPDHYPPLALTPQRQKQKTLEALLVWLWRETEQRPVLLIMEDLHWFDPSTLEFLNLVVDQATSMRLFTLLTCRPTFRPPWPLHAPVTHLVLSRLPRQQAARMIERVAGGKVLPAEVRQQLLIKTDGVPLFVEELTKMVLESGLLREANGRYELTAPLPSLAIPATLYDSLMARLDRLATGKTVAQMGATIGRRFSYELLRAVSPLDESTLHQALGQLVQAELLYQRGLPPQATYTFKHALIQEAAYQSLLKSTRQGYHRQIAQVLDERFPETVETQPELLAHHYTEAGQPAQAVPCWLRAGQRSTERSANVEAVSHLTKGLEVLRGLPDTPERIQHELALHLALGQPLLMIKGQESPELAQVYSRAQELCQRVGDSRQRFSALMGLCSFYNAQGRLQTSRELAEESLALAQGVHAPVLLLEAHITLGSILFCLGEFISARMHLEEGLVLHSRQQHRVMILNRGCDCEVFGATWLAWTLWMLGYPDRALAKSHEALHLAQELSHTYSLALAQFFAAVLHMCCREAQCALDRLDTAMALSKEQGFVRWLAGGMVVRGWALAEQGALEEGIEQLKQGLAAWRAMGGELALPHFLSTLAQAYGKVGRVDEGLRVLEEAQAISHKNAERRFEAELLRIRGELLLQQIAGAGLKPTPREASMAAKADVAATSLRPRLSEVELCFRQAIDLASHQQARSWQLRAVMSLAHLWQTQGRHAEACQILVETYDWFTEGFDTPDLREAKALIEALACTDGRVRPQK
ncbi:MAG TPA: adenylate/guanylate cyclase domain-containing protein [Candidatus Tectomicrobia bacterium]|nr:adenylate/guanylate cyclase domain-containing protein [Candidatus Tectomicrobia bacterium]